MSDFTGDSNDNFEMDVLMASMRIDGKQSASMLDVLAKKFELALPENVEVTRGGWFLSKEKPVEQIVLRFEDAHYVLIKPKHGPVQAMQSKIVRGVAIKTNDISYDQWIALVAQEIKDLASGNAGARDSIRKLL
ncbi:MAG: hypothetical protein K2Q33_03775 [Gammaproteobacteria bacterium]|jgi:hypothetical protein|nr:hypothetical protein [Gammaproteobacteria bacterium]